MCNSVYFSTTSREDFTVLESEHFAICHPDDPTDGPNLIWLNHPNRWIILSRFGGCSCHFRHAFDGFEFTSPTSWRQEDEDDVEATKHVYDLLQRIVLEGHRLDLVDIWDEPSGEDIAALGFSISTVPRKHFMFFSGFHFEISP